MWVEEELEEMLVRVEEGLGYVGAGVCIQEEIRTMQGRDRQKEEEEEEEEEEVRVHVASRQSDNRIVD